MEEIRLEDIEDAINTLDVTGGSGRYELSYNKGMESEVSYGLTFSLLSITLSHGQHRLVKHFPPDYVVKELEGLCIRRANECAKVKADYEKELATKQFFILIDKK